MNKPLKNRLLTGAIILLIIAFSWLFLVSPGRDGANQVYWPTQSWRSCPPEEEGIDSGKLAEGLLTISQKDIDIHSLLIIRDGWVLTDAAFYPYDGKTVHDLASVTKSLMTTLIGIAADQGKLQLDQPMVSFFPGRSIANRDARKDSITVRQLASMSSGLDSLGFAQDEGTLSEMQRSSDWVQFALDRKVVSIPGTHFVYDSPGMHLLSAILQQATGKTALEFARENLFSPLGISDVIWPADPQGISHGWGDVYLHPSDAAKIGYLWLNKGRWDGRQIVSRRWVEDSVKVQATTGLSDDYGYGWWVLSGSTPGEFAAVGRGGQRVQVIPQFKIIVVTTGGGFDIDEIMPYLEPALIDTENPLPANPSGMIALQAAIDEAARAPKAKPVPPLPDIARAISGKTYLLEANPAKLKTLRLDFDGSEEAALSIAFSDGRPGLTQLIGLDGVYRFCPGDYNLPQGMRGYWQDRQTFAIEQDEIAVNDHTNYQIVFSGEHILVSGLETAHELSTTISGRMEKP